MKELDIATLLAVFQEMLGWTLWPLVALSAAATVAFLFVLWRDRGVVARRLVWAEAIGLAGGMAAVLVMQAVTHSRFADLGGPVDWLLVVGIFAAGLIGSAVGAYALLGLLAGAPQRQAEAGARARAVRA
ncbi:MAG: DUF5368 domain-containing protein [Roseococcus sp.]|nr:DUF5368 domain-containing protein [Roseococcus sp.]